MLNPNFPRWVRISIGKHFKTVANSLGLPLQIAGVDDPDSDIFQAAQRSELRIKGPSIKTHDKGIFTTYSYVNVLFTEVAGEEGQNVYSIVDKVGEFQVRMFDAIEVKRFGNGTQDDGTTIGCLELVSGKNDPVELFDFGQLTDNDRVRQLMLDASYYMETSNRDQT